MKDIPVIKLPIEIDCDHRNARQVVTLALQFCGNFKIFLRVIRLLKESFEGFSK